MKKALFLAACLLAAACTRDEGKKSDNTCPDLLGTYASADDGTRVTFTKNAKGQLVGTDADGAMTVDGTEQKVGNMSATMSCSGGAIIAVAKDVNGKSVTITISKSPRGFTMTTKEGKIDYLKVDDPVGGTANKRD